MKLLFKENHYLAERQLLRKIRKRCAEEKALIEFCSFSNKLHKAGFHLKAELHGKSVGPVRNPKAYIRQLTKLPYDKSGLTPLVRLKFQSKI
jgi:hypothetical protein